MSLPLKRAQHWCCGGKCASLVVPLEVAQQGPGSNWLVDGIDKMFPNGLVVSSCFDCFRIKYFDEIYTPSVKQIKVNMNVYIYIYIYICFFILMYTYV